MKTVRDSDVTFEQLSAEVLRVIQKLTACLKNERMIFAGPALEYVLGCALVGAQNISLDSVDPDKVAQMSAKRVAGAMRVAIEQQKLFMMHTDPRAGTVQ